MKGFKKDGKFRPTGKKQGLSKAQIREKKKVTLNKEGFKTRKGQVIYISKGSSGEGWSGRWKEPPREEVVDNFKEMWNKDPQIRKMEKHIEYVSMVNNKTGNNAGTWSNGKAKVKLYDRESMTPEEMNLVVAHEISGHTFWDFSRKWRREALVEFNKIANALPPANDYVETNEEEWKTWNDDPDEIDKLKEEADRIYEEYGGMDMSEEGMNLREAVLLEIQEIENDPDHQTMTRYANEQHSAMTELKYGEGGQEWGYYLTDDEMEELSDAWDELHY